MAKKIVLCCEECGSRNYTYPEKENATRIVLKKYCPRCNRHTLHKQTR
ncbi:MAG: 50S ribosomal protein L33 [Bacilli bacterium]|uniref:Large ribosomal subunit protein bL33 n=1 Tax=Ureibacillus suwonensis TaxID=313007 RepID=A0ABW0R998_9BACL|nr:50S ribosomal protein L33 [Bacilli bacterium]